MANAYDAVQDAFRTTLVGGDGGTTGESHLGMVGGTLSSATASFTRPANTTGYTIGDVVSNDALLTVPNLARVSGGGGYIVGARLWTNLKSIVPAMRVHIFNANSVTFSADNAPHKAVYADVSKRIASFDLPAMSTPADATNSDMSGAIDFTIRVPFIAVGGRDVYALLETLTAFTPASGEAFSLTLIADVN